MTDGDAEDFDKFVARHWGIDSVYRMEDERKAKSKIVAGVAKRGRKPKKSE